MLVLALDTSTPAITVGLVRLARPHEPVAKAQAALAARERDLPAAGSGSASVLTPIEPNSVLAEHTVTDPFGHAEHLMPLVTAVLADAGREPHDVEAVVVGIGPGPFTGLRVGMVTAAALGDALHVPVHGVPSHEATARQMGWAGDFLVVTNARRREVYLSSYGESGARLHGPVVVAPAAVPELLATRRLSPEWVAGAGAGLVADVLALPIREPAAPLSGFLVDCAAGGLLTGAVPGPLTPLYLRRPDATVPSAPKPVLPPTGPVAGQASPTVRSGTGDER